MKSSVRSRNFSDLLGTSRNFLEGNFLCSPQPPFSSITCGRTCSSPFPSISQYRCFKSRRFCRKNSCSHFRPSLYFLVSGHNSPPLIPCLWMGGNIHLRGRTKNYRLLLRAQVNWKSRRKYACWTRYLFRRSILLLAYHGLRSPSRVGNSTLQKDSSQYRYLESARVGLK